MKKLLMMTVAAAMLPLAQADVVWDGGANDGGNLLTKENWSGDVAPAAADTAAIGDAPEAVLSNGTATYAHLKLGTTAGKTGSLTVGSGGNLKVTTADTGALVMGNANTAKGVLTINGGDVTIESLQSGNTSATSTVNMVSGSLTINQWANWGHNSSGYTEFNQSGGTVTLKKGFQIGRQNNGKSVWNMSGGELSGSVGDYFLIGNTGSGYFNLLDGTVNFGSSSASKDVRIAGTASSKGFFTQSGGDVTSSSLLAVGYAGTGTYTISGGTFTSTANMNLGVTSGASGTVTQDGGIVTAKDVRVGHASGATGRYTLNAGTNVTSTGWVQIGPVGAGEYIQNGGELQMNGTSKMQIADGATGEGLYVINGGLCSVDGDNITVGRAGKGVFVMNGGTVAAKKISSGTSSGSHGRVLLNGGTFKATAAGSIFAKGGATTNDWTLGRNFTVDTNGKNVSDGGVALAAASGSSLTKDGDGTLTLAKLPGADSVTVAKGTLALTAGGDNTASAALAHRWSFNGDASDSVGGATAALVGTAAYTEDGKAVTLPGGNNGTSYVNLGKGILVGDNLTLEFWAKRVSVTKWGRVFECGTDQSNFVTVSWVRSTNASQNKLAVKYGAVEQNQTDKMAFTDGERIHFAVRFRKNANGTTTITWVKRNPATGEVVNTSDFTPTGLDEGWTLDKVAEGNFNLGHTDVWTSDNDANAIYDEVRVWHGALSDDALTLSAQKGPDATAEDIAAIVAKNDETATVERTLEIAPGATLVIGDGNTLTQPVLDAGGTLASGTLAVTKRLVVTPGQTMTIASGATLDLSAVTEVALKDASAAVPADGWVIATSSSGGIVSGSKELKLTTGALKGYTLFISPTQARIGKRGLIISFH